MRDTEVKIQGHHASPFTKLRYKMKQSWLQVTKVITEGQNDVEIWHLVQMLCTEEVTWCTISRLRGQRSRSPQSSIRTTKCNVTYNAEF